MDTQLKRYSAEQIKIIEQFFNKLASATRKAGKISDGKKAKIIASWEQYPPQAVIDALNTYIKMDIPPAQSGKGKNEAYVLGIIKNKAKEAEAYGKNKANPGHSKPQSSANADGREDEGSRLAEILGNAGGGEGDIKCDF